MITHIFSMEGIVVGAVGLSIIILFVVVLVNVSLISDDKNDAKSE